ncbi:hypothetical protein V5F77_11465 [Xanthobacter sp. DSM 24535]|uniref:hypothetical protein n=1 Tax=Roseixanthobacter psychrophilus TaxID=3119917 RepID=UPI00372648DF
MAIFLSSAGKANARPPRITGPVFTASLALAGLLIASGAALAQGAYPSGPASVNMSCVQANALVTKAGGTVLNTGGLTYDRYVRDRSFCTYFDVTKPAFVPTRDVKQCFVGYTCIDPSIENGGRR